MNAKGWGRAFAGTLLVLIATADGASAQNRFDAKIASEIGRQIDRYPQLTIFDHVTGKVENGIVTLTGKVTMPFKKSDIGKKASEVAGVRELQNLIDVLPVSTYDEELRLKVARAIYGNAAFWEYGARANPPIHIIVERGHVTLVGVVSSSVDRMLARSLATGQGELSVTNELRTDADVRADMRSE
jgi:hyperosmotically inducible periplasmic protein